MVTIRLDSFQIQSSIPSMSIYSYMPNMFVCIIPAASHHKTQ